MRFSVFAITSLLAISCFSTASFAQNPAAAAADQVPGGPNGVAGPVVGAVAPVVEHPHMMRHHRHHQYKKMMK